MHTLNTICLAFVGAAAKEYLHRDCDPRTWNLNLRGAAHTLNIICLATLCLG